jgi:hypothetical protein
MNSIDNEQVLTAHYQRCYPHERLNITLLSGGTLKTRFIYHNEGKNDEEENDYGGGVCAVSGGGGFLH